MGLSFRGCEDLEDPMNTFYEHHQDSIRFGYRCFDRILLNGLIQPFQQPERVVGFFNTYRELYPVSKPVLNGHRQAVPALGRPLGRRPGARRSSSRRDHHRRDDFVEPYFRRAKPDQVVVILKAREPARILTAIGKEDRWHLQYARRWVNQYNFYLIDREWGRLFVRVCPYFPFSARVCLNQHHWLATRMRAEGISVSPVCNAFLTCSDPLRLQALADSLTARDLARCAQKWLRAFTPFFTPTERRDGQLSASALLRASRVLRQPDLPTPGRAWTRSASGCSMRIGPLDNPRNSPPSSAARSPSGIAANSKR